MFTDDIIKVKEKMDRISDNTVLVGFYLGEVAGILENTRYNDTIKVHMLNEIKGHFEKRLPKKHN